LKHYIFIFKHVNAKEEKTNPDKKNPKKISISFLLDLILKLFIYIVDQIFSRVEPLSPLLLIKKHHSSSLIHSQLLFFSSSSNPQRASPPYLFRSLNNNNNKGKDGGVVPVFFNAFFSAPCLLFQSFVVKDQIWERKELMKMVGSEWWRRFHEKMQNNFGE